MTVLVANGGLLWTILLIVVILAIVAIIFGRGRF